MKAREPGTVFQEAEHEYAEDVNILESYVLCAALRSRCRQQEKMGFSSCMLPITSRRFQQLPDKSVCLSLVIRRKQAR